MEWSQVLQDKSLADLPYKIELNEWGKIEMSPLSNLRGMIQAEIAVQLGRLLKTGKVLLKCSVLTTKNVKVADVAWGSTAFFEANGFETPYRAAPEICVEVVSPSNSAEELMMKKALYFEKGAREFWICGEDGRMKFFSQAGEMEASALCPGFPQTIRAGQGGA